VSTHSHAGDEACLEEQAGGHGWHSQGLRRRIGRDNTIIMGFALSGMMLAARTDNYCGGDACPVIRIGVGKVPGLVAMV
jgi:hypothetical protein